MGSACWNIRDSADSCWVTMKTLRVGPKSLSLLNIEQDSSHRAAIPVAAKDHSGRCPVLVEAVRSHQEMQILVHMQQKKIIMNHYLIRFYLSWLGPSQATIVNPRCLNC